MRLTPVYANLPASNPRITSWNCRSLSAGLPYAEVLAESSDILIISEHWLWPFEVHNFQNIRPDMNSLVVTDKRLTPECTLTRGCGGVGIAWKKHLAVTLFEKVKSDRICAITVETTLAPTLIIGIYLPTTNTPTDIYQDCLSDME